LVKLTTFETNITNIVEGEISMKVHTRIVIETDPEVKQMVDKIKHMTGKSIKNIMETLIRDEYKKYELS
jgi:hypothetical protein